jgi:hypothetical protein
MGIIQNRRFIFAEVRVAPELTRTLRFDPDPCVLRHKGIPRRARRHPRALRIISLMTHTSSSIRVLLTAIRAFVCERLPVSCTFPTSTLQEEFPSNNGQRPVWTREFKMRGWHWLVAFGRDANSLSRESWLS